MNALGACCGEEWTAETASVTQEGVHLVARCPACHQWLRALPGPSEDYLLPFGKHKGALVVELWLDDPAYCAWLLTVAKPRLRQVLEETRP